MLLLDLFDGAVDDCFLALFLLKREMNLFGLSPLGLLPGTSTGAVRFVLDDVFASGCVVAGGTIFKREVAAEPDGRSGFTVLETVFVGAAEGGC